MVLLLMAPPALVAQAPAAPQALNQLQELLEAVPEALIDGKPATVDEAVHFAAELLHAADMPLVYGLSNITCEATREAVSLAELIGGVIDSHTSL